MVKVLLIAWDAQSFSNREYLTELPFFFNVSTMNCSSFERVTVTIRNTKLGPPKYFLKYSVDMEKFRLRWIFSLSQSNFFELQFNISQIKTLHGNNSIRPIFMQNVKKKDIVFNQLAILGIVF